MVAQHFVLEQVGGLRTYHQVLEYIGEPPDVRDRVPVPGRRDLARHARAALGHLRLRAVGGARKRSGEPRARGPGRSVTVAYGFILIGTLAVESLRAKAAAVVGIVIVSHSYRIAEGVAELAREMGGPDVRLETAGGLDLPDHPDRHGRGDGDGSHRTRLVRRRRARADGSRERGAVRRDGARPAGRGPAARSHPPVRGPAGRRARSLPPSRRRMGSPLEAVAAEARGGLAGKIAHLGADATSMGTSRLEDRARGDGGRTKLGGA